MYLKSKYNQLWAVLSHSLSFWFRALVAHEPDVALEREVQKGCRSSRRKCVVTSPCWGCEVNVVHVHIFQEGTEMRSGRITVCLSVCLFSAREARPGPLPAPVSPCSQGQLQLVPAATALPTSFSRTVDGHSLAQSSLGPRNWSSPWGGSQAKVASMAAQAAWLSHLLLPRGMWDQFQPGREEHVLWNPLNLSEGRNSFWDSAAQWKCA